MASRLRTYRSPTASRRSPEPSCRTVVHPTMQTTATIQPTHVSGLNRLTNDVHSCNCVFITRNRPTTRLNNTRHSKRRCRSRLRSRLLCRCRSIEIKSFQFTLKLIKHRPKRTRSYPRTVSGKSQLSFVVRRFSVALKSRSRTVSRVCAFSRRKWTSAYPNTSVSVQP